MAWYRAGTVAVTNGSVLVTGAGTAWVGNAQAGHAINLPDGRVYEVLSVDSNVQITLGSAYLGGTAAGQAYSIQPNQGFAQSAATKLTEFLAQIGGWVSGALAGRFGDGSLAAPGISFAVDQDTGFRRYGENISSVVCGGADIAIFGPAGTSFSAKGSRVAQMVTEGLALDTGKGLLSANFPKEMLIPSDGVAGWLWQTDGRILVQYSSGATKMALDATGNLLVGVATGSAHRITKGGNGGDLIIGFDNGRYGGVAIYAGDDGPQGSSALSVMKLTRVGATQRSINAGGTINASGADYAEYMVKATGCGIIAKGDVCGVDRDGKLTKAWADAISFVVKSTDPSLVGGDNWAAHLPPRPEQGEDEDTAAFESRLAAWEAELEEARLCVDRIAFCGQVPCNVTGDFDVGDYIVAAANGGGIKAVAVKADDMTLPQYMRRIGKVWAIRDGRAWIDVQHG